MIPKVIHYCWFGGNPHNELTRKCIESWKKFCPDYEIIQWDESNFDVNCIPYLSAAYKEQKYAHVTDYARLKIVYEHGGIYLDTDVELIKSLDEFLDQQAFFAMQDKGLVATGLGFGAEAGAQVVKDLMKNYEEKQYDKDEKFLTETCVDIDKKVFEHWGLKSVDQVQKLNDAVVYSTEYFNPKDFETDVMNITEHTVSIHHYNRSWYDESEWLIHEKLKELMCKYEPDEAKKRFGRWYRRNRIRLVYKRYGLVGITKKLTTKFFYGKIG